MGIQLQTIPTQDALLKSDSWSPAPDIPIQILEPQARTPTSEILMKWLGATPFLRACYIGPAALQALSVACKPAALQHALPWHGPYIWFQSARVQFAKSLGPSTDLSNARLLLNRYRLAASDFMIPSLHRPLSLWLWRSCGGRSALCARVSTFAGLPALGLLALLTQLSRELTLAFSWGRPLLFEGCGADEWLWVPASRLRLGLRFRRKEDRARFGLERRQPPRI